jgi:hypothetical protein
MLLGVNVKNPFGNTHQSQTNRSTSTTTTTTTYVYLLQQKIHNLNFKHLFCSSAADAAADPSNHTLFIKFDATTGKLCNKLAVVSEKQQRRLCVCELY